MLTAEEREERKQENREWVEARFAAEAAVFARYQNDAAVRDAVVNRVDGSPAFWGTRYTVQRKPYGKDKFTWDVVDGATIPVRHVAMGGLRRHAQEQADQLNRDPTADYNGIWFPAVHNRSNVFNPVTPCDCLDPPRGLGEDLHNVCDRTVGSYCATHGKHDECPRDVRAIGLECDPERLVLKRLTLEHKRREIEWQLADMDSEFEHLQGLEELAERLGLTRLPVNPPFDRVGV